MTPLVEVAGLSKRFPAHGRQVRAVSEVSFTIGRGQVFALVGESGSGKTTVGRLILRLIEPSEGSIRFDGVELAPLSERAMRPLRRRMQVVFQDPFSSLNPFLQVGDAIAEPLTIHGLANRAGRARRVSELLDLVGLPGAAAERYPHQFSGGQRQRIAIARALAAEPDFLVADEAVSALDVSIQAQILNLLADLKDRLGLTMLFIGHDLGVVRHLADRIGVMYAGRLVETGPAAGVIDRPAHPYTRALVSAAPTLDRTSRPQRIVLRGDPPSPLDPPAGCPFSARCPEAAAGCGAAVPPLRSVSSGRTSACLFDPPRPARTVLEAV